MTVDELLQPMLNTTVPLRPTDSRETIPAWDSLAQINIVAAIEDAVGVELSTAEVLSLKSVAKVVEVARSHGLELTINAS
ncbi:MAG TPA: acyl carrier protein [Methylomirabilota bacterium]|nr:acyl carrier protein [Methylomirabilota bacterium]